MGVDGLVEYRTYELGLSPHPLFQPFGDTYEFEGRIFSNKQPGLAALGAFVYLPLRAVGITYENNYDLVSALVTWFVSAGFAALGVVFFFRILFDLWRFPYGPSVVAALLFGCGTTLLPYSGVLYHDTVAAALLVVAFYFLERARLERARRAKILAAAAAGCVLGWVICVSLLPLVVVAILIGYGCLWCRRWPLVALLGGFAVGLLPLLGYNWHSFGSPFLMGYIALRDTRISPQLNLPHMATQLSEYIGWGKVAIAKYCPLVILGLCSLPLLDRRVRPAAVLIAVVATGHLLYVATMPTLGVCQFPPRFLLPLIPFTVLPLAMLMVAPSKAGRWVGPAAVIIVGGFSIGTNLLGALHGTMNCDLYNWLPARMLAESSTLSQAAFPVWQPAAALLAITALSGWYQWTRRRLGTTPNAE